MIKKICLLILCFMIADCCIGVESNDINILPTPKEMKVLPGIFGLDSDSTYIVTGANADKRSILGADEINKKIKELGGKPLPVISEGSLDAAYGKNMILIGTPEENSIIKKYQINIPDKGQGYIVSSIPEKEKTVYVLSGKDAIGTLYACVSFRYLIRKDQRGLYAYNAAIRDWPDCRNRMVFIASDFKQGSEKFIPLLDWLLYHKCNYALVDTWSISNGNYTVPENQKIIQEIRKFNDYAAERGIVTVDLMFYWSIGYVPEDKDKPELKGATVAGKGIWCFSRDDLIIRKAEKIARFIKNAGFKGVVMHARDGSPTEYWTERCADCKKRFGDDRAAADANFINNAYRTIRSEIPDAKLFFVVEPYYGNIDIPQNAPYKEYFQKLTALIPEDLYLGNGAWDREAQDSWKNTIRQPVLQWRNIMMDPWHSGKDFSTMPCFSVKTGYYPESDDISFPNTHVGTGIPDVFPLMSMEFMWNVNAPGTFMLTTDASAKPERQIENLYKYPYRNIDGIPYSEWQWSKSSTEPQIIAYELLPRICDEAFGKDASPMMCEILRMGIARRILLMDCPLYNNAEYYNTFHDATVIGEQYEKAQKAVDMLAAYKESGKDFRKLEGFFREMRIAAFGGKSHYHMLLAEGYCKSKKIREAELELQTAKENLKAAVAQLKKWEYSHLNKIEKVMDSVAFKIAIMGRSKNTDPSAVKVGIYNPNEVGGKVYGEMFIYTTLLNTNGIKVEFMPDMENLFQYDCVIIPDCKKLGTKDQGSFLVVEKEVFNAEQKLRDYVMLDGKGILFYHDSVGFERFAMGRPVFPELCQGAKRVDSRDVSINAEHPVTKGLKNGERFKHLYFDHIQMKPCEQGLVVAGDNEAAVVIAGELGKGRVVLNGTIIYRDNEEAVKEAVGIDKTLLVNSVFWLAGKRANEK